MITTIIVLVLALIVSIFTFWKFLEDDYPDELIFTVIFTTIIFSGAGFIINLFFKTQFVFWISGFFLIFGFLFSYLRNKFPIYEFFEGLVRAAFFFFEVMLVYFMATKQSIVGLGVLVINSIVIFIYFLLSKNYKKFTWYKSGKIGFAGITAAGIFFVVRGIVAFFALDFVSFAGRIEPLLAGSVSFIFFLILYNLSRQ